MDTQLCKSCVEYRRCQDSFYSWFFFIIGIIATIALRVVTLLIHVDAAYAQIAWYVGVAGFFLFFVYKYRVGRVRSKVIGEMNLVEKIRSKTQLSGEDYTAVSAILCALSSKKETVNYFIIFALSALALLLAVYMDFIR
ncbi:MAG: hypothetical protein RDV41_06725 [Planctomycetota bacterium]|nr:hypothetical protein [Planctomycetota bacterium]